MIPGKTKELGSVRYLSAYEYFDGPEPDLFSAINEQEQAFLVFWCDVTEKEYGYLWVPVSVELLQSLESRKLSFREVCMDAEKWYLVYIGPGGTRVESHAELPLDFLPPPGYFVENITELK